MTTKYRSYDSTVSCIVKNINNTINRAPNTLTSFFKEVYGFGVILVGSGGSLTTAHFFAQLLERNSGEPCPVYTPLELTYSLINLNSRHIIFFSAEGKNPDILNAFYFANSNKAKITCITNFPVTPLGILCEKHSHTLLILRQNEKDGFLATNTIITSVIAGYKAFQDINNEPLENIDSLDFNKPTSSDFSEISSLIIVYAPTLKPAAIDIESRASESGLCNVQLADLRSFSHGRHYGAYLNRNDIQIIILTDDLSRSLARLTRSVIGSSLPVLLEHFPGSHAISMLSSIIYSMKLISQVSKSKEKDPYKVNVPKFGRALYYLPYDMSHHSLKASHSHLLNIPDVFFGKRFGAVIFDYDGTLCYSKDRYQPLLPVVAVMLESLLESGIKVGVATGRGKSAGEMIRKAIAEEFWPLITIGYYNGSVILSADVELDISSNEDDPELLNIFETLQSSETPKLEITKRPTQLTIEFKDNFLENAKADSYCKHIHTLSKNVKTLCSSHSIDILNKKTSKLNVLKNMEYQFECLTVGDSGQVGGNDHELLSHSYSVSVNYPYSKNETGVKIGLEEDKELSATLRLFECMIIKEGYFTFED